MSAQVIGQPGYVGAWPGHGNPAGVAAIRSHTWSRILALALAILPRARWRLHNLHALAGQDIIERGRELSVAVPDEEPEHPGTPGEIHDQIAGLLGLWGSRTRPQVLTWASMRLARTR